MLTSMPTNFCWQWIRHIHVRVVLRRLVKILHVPTALAWQSFLLSSNSSIFFVFIKEYGQIVWKIKGIFWQKKLSYEKNLRRVRVACLLWCMANNCPLSYVFKMLSDKFTSWFSFLDAASWSESWKKVSLYNRRII